MKKYYYSKDKKHRYIHVFTATSADECSMCQGMRNFINVIYPQERYQIPVQILNLAKANLQRHLKTGKHWKSIGEERT